MGAGPGSERDSVGLSGPSALSLFLKVSPLPDPVSLSLHGTPPPGPSITPEAPRWGLCRVWSPADPLAPHLPPAAPGARWGPTTRRRGRVHRSICTGPCGRCPRGPGGSRPREPHLGPPGRALGEVLSPLLGQSESGVANVRATLEGQVLSRGEDRALPGQEGGLPRQPWGETRAGLLGPLPLWTPISSPSPRPHRVSVCVSVL